MFLSLLLSSMIVQNLPPETPVQPNIVMILTDDMGWTDLGCYGSTKNTTPCIDQMAKEGMRFTQAYAAASVCTPSRAGLLTGRYPHLVGLGGAALWFNAKNGLDTKYSTMSSHFKKANYATGCFGKWHLGQQKNFMPNAHGFDMFEGIPYSNSMWSLRDDGSKEKFPPLPYYRNTQQIDQIDSHDKMNHLTQRITHSAVDFIHKNAKQNHPFFLYLAHPQPHVPLACADSFKDKGGNGLFSDVMFELDASMGAILNALKQNGIDSNTLVVFTSDNGPWLNYGNHSGTCDGLREGKMTVFEGGFRVPCIIRYPGKIKSGVVADSMISHIDFFKTFATRSNTMVPSDAQGVDLTPYLLGKTNVSPRKKFDYFQNQTKLAEVENNIKTVYPHQSQSYEGCVRGRDGKAGATKRVNVPKSKFNLSFDLGENQNLYEKQQHLK